MIVAPEPVAGFAGGPHDMAVVVSVGRVLAPGVLWADAGRRRQQRRPGGGPVGAPPTAASGGTSRAGQRHPPRACSPGCRPGRARPGWQAARRAARHGCESRVPCVHKASARPSPSMPFANKINSHRRLRFVARMFYFAQRYRGSSPGGDHAMRARSWSSTTTPSCATRWSSSSRCTRSSTPSRRPRHQGRAGRAATGTSIW